MDTKAEFATTTSALNQGNLETIQKFKFHHFPKNFNYKNLFVIDIMVHYGKNIKFYSLPLLPYGKGVNPIYPVYFHGITLLHHHHAKKLLHVIPNFPINSLNTHVKAITFPCINKNIYVVSDITSSFVQDSKIIWQSLARKLDEIIPNHIQAFPNNVLITALSFFNSINNKAIV